MSNLKEFKSWLSAYKKANDNFPDEKTIYSKVNEFLKKEKDGVSASKSKQIFFRESQWSNYEVLRDDLLKDKKFVKDYAGVDLKAYIEEALAWSEKGKKSTDLGWRLTLKNWMRNAKNQGRLIMKPVVDKKSNGTGHINY